MAGFSLFNRVCQLSKCVVVFFLTMHTIILVCISGIRIEFPFKKIDWINERVMVFNVNFNNITVISWQYMNFKLHVKIYWEHCNMLVVLICLLIFDFVSCHSILIYLSIFSKLSIREIYKLCMFHRR
jgi:hypothetical protein